MSIMNDPQFTDVETGSERSNLPEITKVVSGVAGILICILVLLQKLFTNHFSQSGTTSTLNDVSPCIYYWLRSEANEIRCEHCYFYGKTD